MAHTGQVAGRGGDQVDLRVQGLEFALKHHGGEDGGAGGHVAGALAHGVGGHHAGTSVAFRRGQRDTRLKRAGRVEQSGAFLGEFAGRRAGDQRLGQQVLELPRLRGDFGQRVEPVDERGLPRVGFRVDGEHARGVAHAEHLPAGELPVHVAGQGGEEGDLGDVLLVVEHALVQVGDGPAFRDVVLEQLGELLMRLVGVGVLPGAERHEQFAVLVERQIAVHHGRESDVADVGELLAVGGLHVVGHLGVGGLQALPDLLDGVAPQAVLQMAGPAVIAGGDGAVGVVDEDGLDSRGTELDAERGLARADLLRDRGNLIGIVLHYCHGGGLLTLPGRPVPSAALLLFVNVNSRLHRLVLALTIYSPDYTRRHPETQPGERLVSSL